MKKKFLCGIASLLFACTMVYAQSSLLNEATNGLFHNVNDFVIKPNIMFNTVETRQIIIGGDFDNMGFESGINGGGLIGYYNPGKMPWSIAGVLDMKSGDSNHNVNIKITDAQGNTVKETTYKNPSFSQYEGGVRFNIGIPKTLNISIGAVAYFRGNGTNAYETSSSSGGTETITYRNSTETFHMTLGIPIGLAFTSSVYNLFEPFIFFDQTKTIATTNSEKEKTESNETATKFMLYDKLIIQGLSLFGDEMGFWLGFGNSSPHIASSTIPQNISELETPAYRVSSVRYDVKFVSQLGIYNLVDFSAANIQFKLKPMAYLDLLLGSHKSVTFGATIASSAGVYAPLGNLPIAIFFGVTPALQFYTTNSNTEASAGTNTIRTETASRALTTNVIWSGKFGASILLPKNMTLDITLDMDTSEKSLGLAAQMSVAL